MIELPTSTLAELLNRARAEDDPSDVFTCGSIALDRLLSGGSVKGNGIGVRRGGVVEISGPPGSGKTTLGLLIVLDALKRGHKAIWMSNLSPLPLQRLVNLTTTASTGCYEWEDSEQTASAKLGSLYHVTIRTLTELLLLFNDGSKLPECAVLIMDELPFNTSLGDANVRAEVMRRISNIARQRRIAVVIFSQMKSEYIYNANYFVSNMSSGSGGEDTWEYYVDSRVVLYRDLSFMDQVSSENGVLHAVKCGSKRKVCFEITASGIVELMVYGENDSEYEDEQEDYSKKRKRIDSDNNSNNNNNYSDNNDSEQSQSKRICCTPPSTGKIIEVPDSQGFDEEILT